MTQETVKALQDKIILMESQFSGEKRQLANERVKSRDAAQEENQRHMAKIKEMEKMHGERFAELNERHVRLQREMAAMQAAVPAAAGGTHDAVDAAAAAAARAEAKNKESWQKQAAKNYKSLESTKDEQIKNLKEQGQYFLKKKDEELRTFVSEYETYKKAKDAETKQLTVESEYLHAWAMAMNAIIQRIEEGAYVVKERSGLRTLVIPSREKPGSLDADVLANKAAAARRFLEETSKSAPDFDFEAFREHGRLVEEERSAIEAATLKELSSHPTVEYIRHLEEENRRLSDSLSDERKKTADMRVALNSTHRALAAAGQQGVTADTGDGAYHHHQPQPRASTTSAAGDGVVGSRPSSSHPSTVRPLSSSQQQRPALPISVGNLAGANLAAGRSARDPMHVAFGATSKPPSVASSGGGGGGSGSRGGSRPGSSRPGSSRGGYVGGGVENIHSKS